MSEMHSPHELERLRFVEKSRHCRFLADTPYRRHIPGE